MEPEGGDGRHVFGDGLVRGMHGPVLDAGASELEIVDEAQGDMRTGFDHVVVDGLLDVADGEFASDDALDGFNAGGRPLIRSLSAAK